MNGLAGSALRRTERVIAAQGFDARTFDGGRTLRLLIRVSSRGRPGYKQLFIANLIGRSLTDAYAAVGRSSAVVVGDSEFDAPPQVGPAKISVRRLHMADQSEAIAFVTNALNPNLVVSLDNLGEAPKYPGPFSVAVQDIAAGLRPRIGITLYGVRLLCAEPHAVVEAIYSVMAASREEAAAIVARDAVEDGHCEGAICVEVEDTHFDRAYDNNSLLILEHQSPLGLVDYLRVQRLDRVPFGSPGDAELMR